MSTFAFAILALVPLGPAAAQSHEEFVSDYCLTCHNDVSRTGGLSLEAFDAAHPEAAAEIAEKMIRKLDAGMMPPSMIRYLVSKGADAKAVNREGQSTADMANGPVQRIQPFPEALDLLVSLGAKNNHKCVSC